MEQGQIYQGKLISLEGLKLEVNLSTNKSAFYDAFESSPSQSLNI